MLQLLALASMSLALFQTGGEPLGTAKIGDKEVQISVPATPRSIAIPANAAHVEFSGQKFLLLPGGLVGRRYVEDGFWGDVRQFYAASQLSKTTRKEWKVKVYVLTRGEILERGRDSIYRLRRSTLEPKQIDEIYSSLARFKAMAEGYSDGHLSLSFDVTLDDDPIRIEASKPGAPFDDAFLKSEFGPRINSARFDTEDKVDRGPFDSVFVVNAALTKGARTVLTGGQPISLVSYYTNPYVGLEGALSIALYDQWIWQLAIGAQRQGYSVTSDGLITDPQDPKFGIADPKAFMTNEMWSVVGNRQDPSDAAFVSRHWRPDEKISVAWDSVRADPWANLPSLALQNQDRLSYSGALIQSIGGDSFAVRLDAADLFAASTGANVTGFWSSPFGQVLIFQKDGLGDQPITAEKLKLAVAGSLDWWGQPKPPASPNIALRTSAWGNWAAKLVQDPAKGPAVETTESKAFRLGSATIADGGGSPMFDPTATPILEFWVKPTVIESYSIEVKDIHGNIIASSVIGIPPRIPVEANKDEMISTPYFPAKVGDWQKVTIDLRKGPTGMIPWEVVVEAPQNGKYFERQVGGPTILSFAGFTARAPTSEDAQSAPLTEIPLTDVEQRAAQAAKVQDPASEADKAMLFELLKDQKELVRMNAAAALTKIRAPDTVPLLIEQSKSATPQIAEFAIDALAFQGTNEAWGSILERVVGGPFDFNRQYATRQMGIKGDGLVANIVTTMMTSRSWHGRLEGALALPKMPGKETQLMLISLLQEIEPGVRLAVTQGADPSVELVSRRLLWAAVNDPSEEIRGASFLVLTRAPQAEYKSEGFKGVRNESKAIRLMLIDSFRAKPNEEQRGALRLAVADSSAEVRAAALRAFAGLPNPVEAAEIENTFTDKDPRVQTALLELAKAKGIKLPDAAIQNLKASVDKKVAGIARSLGG